MGKTKLNKLLKERGYTRYSWAKERGFNHKYVNLVIDRWVKGKKARSSSPKGKTLFILTELFKTVGVTFTIPSTSSGNGLEGENP